MGLISDLQERAKQAASSVTDTVLCPKCDTNVLDTGFILHTTIYEAYSPDKGRLRKSHKKRSTIVIPHCALCGAGLFATVKTLTSAIKDAA